MHTRVSQALNQRYGLVEARDARRSRIERKADRCELALHMTCTDAELEATFGQQIDAGCIARDDRGVAELVVEHEGAHPEPRRGLSHSAQRHQRREHALGQMVGHRQRVALDRAEVRRHQRFHAYQLDQYRHGGAAAEPQRHQPAG